MSRIRVFRYVRIERIDDWERAGWFWRYKDAPMPGSHGMWSVVMEWLCDCPDRIPARGDK